MERQEILDKVKNVISEEIDIPLEDINENSAMMDDLDLSSLEILTIIGEIEKVFSIRFDMRKLKKIINIDDFIDLILECQEARK